MSNTKMEKGISIYLVIIISTLILAIALGISTIIISQIKMAREIGHSVVAFYAADAGIEAVLDNPDGYATDTICYGYLDLDGSGGTGNSGCPPAGQDCSVGLTTHPNDSCYAVKKFIGVNCPPTAGYCIDSVGYFQKTRRAIQISR